MNIVPEMTYYVLSLYTTTPVVAVCNYYRMINQCLQSVFTQVNFFIHNLAQMKFSGHDDGALLSFIPKTYRLSPLCSSTPNNNIIVIAIMVVVSASVNWKVWTLAIVLLT